MPPTLEEVAGGVNGLSSGADADAEVAAGSTGLDVAGLGVTGLGLGFTGGLAAVDDEAPAAAGVAVFTAVPPKPDEAAAEDDVAEDVPVWTAGMGGGGRMSLTGGLRNKASALGNCEKSWNNRTLTKSIAERFE